jgi:hypothetical protein
LGETPLPDHRIAVDCLGVQQDQWIARSCTSKRAVGFGTTGRFLRASPQGFLGLGKRELQLPSRRSFALWPKQAENFRNGLIHLIKPLSALFNLRG